MHHELVCGERDHSPQGAAPPETPCSGRPRQTPHIVQFPLVPSALLFTVVSHTSSFKNCFYLCCIPVTESAPSPTSMLWHFQMTPSLLKANANLIATDLEQKGLWNNCRLMLLIQTLLHPSSWMSRPLRTEETVWGHEMVDWLFLLLILEVAECAECVSPSNINTVYSVLVVPCFQLVSQIHFQIVFECCQFCVRVRVRVREGWGEMSQVRWGFCWSSFMSLLKVVNPAFRGLLWFLPLMSCHHLCFQSAWDSSPCFFFPLFANMCFLVLFMVSLLFFVFYYDYYFHYKVTCRVGLVNEIFGLALTSYQSTLPYSLPSWRKAQNQT